MTMTTIERIIDTTVIIDMAIPMPIQQWQEQPLQLEIDAAHEIVLAEVFPGV